MPAFYRPSLLALLTCLSAFSALPASSDERFPTTVAACETALSKTAIAGDEMPPRLRVASWNIMKEELAGAAALRDELAAWSNLLLTQEAIESAKPVPGERVFAPGYRRGDLQTGIALHSDSVADTVCTLSFTEPWLRTPKAVLVARFPFRDRALLVINLHAINFTLGSSAYSSQLDAIRKLVATHRGPALVAGDFNHWNPWRRGVLKRFAEKAGLTEAQFTPDWRSRHLGAAVDSAFVRGLKVVSAVAVPTETSDHHPVRILLDTADRSAADTRAAASRPGPGH